MSETTTTTPSTEYGPASAVERMARKTQRQIERTREAEKERDASKKEAEDLRKQVADLSKVTTETEALKAELRTVKHRSVADQLLREAGIRGDAIEVFYKASGMQFEGDAPDPAKVKSFIEEAKPKLSFLFKSDDGTPTPEDEAPNPGPGRGQGGTAPHPPGKFQASEAQLRDPAWCFRNQDALQKWGSESQNTPTSELSDKFVIV